MKNTIKFILSVSLIVVIVFYAEQVTEGAYSSLEICSVSVIPALFPFFVISGFLVNSGFANIIGSFFSPVSEKLFKTSGAGAFSFVIGILCGYPTGAKTIADMYKSGNLSKQESERLLAFCNNSGPLFVIGSVGITMLGNKNAGIVLYIIHVLSAFLTGVVLSLFCKKTKISTSSKIAVIKLGRAITKSVEDAVKSCLLVCGYVVFFGSVINVAKMFLKNPFIVSLAEITTGAKMITSAELTEETIFLLLSCSMAFGGLCVLLQVKSVISDTDLSVRTYILGKSFQAVCAFVITKLYLSLSGSVFTFSAETSKTVPDYTYIPLVFFAISGVLVLVLRLTKRS